MPKTPPKKTPTLEINHEDLQSLVIYAQRYAIGRLTYAPAEIKDIVLKHLPNLSDNTLNVIVSDIDYHQKKKSLGTQADEALWLDLKQQLIEALASREQTA